MVAQSISLIFLAHNSTLYAGSFWNQQPQRVLGLLELLYIAHVIYMYFVCVNLFQTEDDQLPFAKITKHHVLTAYHMIG